MLCGYVRRMTGRRVPAMRRVAERGATMLEYALVLTFIAVVVTTALVTFGPAVSDLFVTATNGL